MAISCGPHCAKPQTYYKFPPIKNPKAEYEKLKISDVLS